MFSVSKFLSLQIRNLSLQPGNFEFTNLNDFEHTDMDMNTNKKRKSSANKIKKEHKEHKQKQENLKREYEHVIQRAIRFNFKVVLISVRSGYES